LVGERWGGPVAERLKRVGMDGPKMSVSRMPVRRPRRAKARERFAGREVRGWDFFLFIVCGVKWDG
jgi:hypothetical protein